MKIPKEISAALKKRTKAAEDLMDVDSIITDFINEHGIAVEEYDYCTGVEMYANPYASEERVRNAILNHRG